MPSALPSATPDPIPLSTIPISPNAAPSNHARRASLRVLSRNVDKIILGNILFRTWYYSPYPDSIILGDDHATNPPTTSTSVLAASKHAIANANTTVTINGVSEGVVDRALADRSPSIARATATALIPPPPPAPCATLHVCPYCFRYTPKSNAYVQHLRQHRVTYDPYQRSNSEDSNPRNTDTEVESASNSDSSDGDDTRAWPVPESAVKVYEFGGYAVWDVDGEREKLYCQNLSLFGKLFLEQKSVFFDTGGFHYFVLTYTPPLSQTSDGQGSEGVKKGTGRRRTSSAAGATTTTTMKNSNNAGSGGSENVKLPDDIILRTQVLGFFSKENLSWDANNLACILVFPPYQHRNLGQLLMAVSYKLSGWEWEDSIIGGPEKPLSAMGRKSYLRFWSERVARFMMGQTTDADGRRVFDRVRKRKKVGYSKEEMTVREIGDRTGMLAEDVVAALNEMGVIEVVAPKRKKRKSEGDEGTEEMVMNSMVVSRNRILQWARLKSVDLVSPVREEGFLGEWALSEADDEDLEDDQVEETE